MNSPMQCVPHSTSQYNFWVIFAITATILYYYNTTSHSQACTKNAFYIKCFLRHYKRKLKAFIKIYVTNRLRFSHTLYIIFLYVADSPREECTYFIMLLKLKGYLQLKISLNHKMKYLHATKEFAILEISCYLKLSL